jgi:hypothetical protein
MSHDAAAFVALGSVMILGGLGIALVLRNAARRRDRNKLLAELAALPHVKADFTTPEGAILRLEEAYRRHDLEAAVACRDFGTEARLWLQKNETPPWAQTEMLPALTQTMEELYRKHMAEFWPSDWGRAKSYFPRRDPYAEKIVAVSEVTIGPDGSLLRQRILVAETPQGWRVVTHELK